MASGEIFPESDVTAQWTGYPLFSPNHWDLLNENHGNANDNNYIRASETEGDDNAVDTFDFTSLEDVDEVTRIVVWTRGWKGSNHPEIDLNIGGWKGYEQCTLPDAIPNWTSNTWNGSWSQAQLNALQVRYRADLPLKFGLHLVMSCYIVVTYSEVVPEGYGHDFMGVPAANIDSVNGIPTANIDTIKGV